MVLKYLHTLSSSSSYNIQYMYVYLYTCIDVHT